MPPSLLLVAGGSPPLECSDRPAYWRIWRQILCDSFLWQDGRSSGCRAGQVAAFLRGIGHLIGPIMAAPLDAQRVDECLRAHYSRVWKGLDQLSRKAAASVTLTT